MYRGRLAPSPTGLLHMGHARIFWTAFERARVAGGVLALRMEDLDPQRSKPEFAQATIEALQWLGIRWQEGPVWQSERTASYRQAWQKLLTSGYIYPCRCSRSDLAASPSAPHDVGGEASPDLGEDAEPIYPGTCRRMLTQGEISGWLASGPAGANWRFRVPNGETARFIDGNSAFAAQSFTAGKDFGDFAVWRRDDVPAYQLACVVDDAAMHITEVVRGADLLLSTARQILLQRALGLPNPEHYHSELVRDSAGRRLAKRDAALSLRSLRKQGWTPERVRATFSPA